MMPPSKVFALVLEYTFEFIATVDPAEAFNLWN